MAEACLPLHVCSCVPLKRTMEIRQLFLWMDVSTCALVFAVLEDAAPQKAFSSACRFVQGEVNTGRWKSKQANPGKLKLREGEITAHVSFLNSKPLHQYGEMGSDWQYCNWLVFWCPLCWELGRCRTEDRPMPSMKQPQLCSRGQQSGPSWLSTGGELTCRCSLHS